MQRLRFGMDYVYVIQDYSRTQRHLSLKSVVSLPEESQIPVPVIKYCWCVRIVSGLCPLATRYSLEVSAQALRTPPLQGPERERQNAGVEPHS